MIEQIWGANLDVGIMADEDVEEGGWRCQGGRQ